MNGSARRRALLIGIELYEDPFFDRLPSTRADCGALRGVFGDRTIGGFDVTVVENPSADEFREHVRRFCAESVTDELALLYVSGHGARGADGEFTFVTTDTDHRHLAGTGVSAGAVNALLEDCWAREQVAIFDTCESGAFSTGFRTRVGPGRKGAVPPAPSRAAPVRPRGVYVLASSDVGQASFSGPDSTVDAPTPSIFTAAIVDVLRTGAAGASAGGLVTVDDLYKAVHDRLVGREPPQTPLRSAHRVVGNIGIAARPLGRSPSTGRGPAPAPVRSSSEEDDDRGGPAPDWPTLLRYYVDTVRAGAERPELLVAGSSDYVDVAGAERVLRGVPDADGTIPLPDGADALVDAARQNQGPTLWVGWPTVVLPGKAARGRATRPACAPLLMRLVEAVDGETGTRLRPVGDVVPHPGLAHALLGDEAAGDLLGSYRPTWHRGESARMAQDAVQLLRDPFELECVEELRPETLAGHVDVATPGTGARNAAILFGIPETRYNAGLLKDLGRILGRPTTIRGTALAALYPGNDSPSSEPVVEPVTPVITNNAQDTVLHAAMTRRLTVATGPPGTGKSQLIVAAVATAVAAGQSVLVASTNNRAVDEVHERCRLIDPGMLIRTGTATVKEQETRALGELLRNRSEGRSAQTRTHAHRHHRHRLSQARERLAELARQEAELHRVHAVRSAAARHVGHSTSDIARLLGPEWAGRARKLITARFLGEWRRRRFLRPLGVPPALTGGMCRAMADLDAAERRIGELHGALGRAGCPEPLLDEVEAARQAVVTASADVVTGTVTDLARRGAHPIRELWQRHGPDWGELAKAMKFLPAWAVTSLSARRFPTDPGLFDLVIIDEASQCTIPSIVPLLFRARRALVIGDPLQLGHIPSIDAGTDAALRRRRSVSRDWLGEHHLSPIRHSAYAAAEHAAGGSLLLDEHYRCHPEIIGASNRLFYQGRLTVLTDRRAPGRQQVSGAAMTWRECAGKAERGPSGKSWCNAAETREVDAVVRELLGRQDGPEPAIPPDATIGVVTPYKAQADRLERMLSDFDDRVRVGTAHRFQGGERDVIVLSLVAGENQPPATFDWIDRQPELWNVAITRARSRLVVVGNSALWERRGHVGAELLAAARGDAAEPGTIVDGRTLDRLYAVLYDVGGGEVRIGVSIDGLPADAVLPDGRAVLVDPGPPDGVDPAYHLERMLRRTRLFGSGGVRLPLCMLDGDGTAARRLLTTERIPSRH